MYQDTSSSLDPSPRTGTIDGIPVDLVADLDADFWELVPYTASWTGQPLVDDCV